MKDAPSFRARKAGVVTWRLVDIAAPIIAVDRCWEGGFRQQHGLLGEYGREVSDCWIGRGSGELVEREEERVGVVIRERVRYHLKSSA
jgi:hypothetical protein